MLKRLILKLKSLLTKQILHQDIKKILENNPVKQLFFSNQYLITKNNLNVGKLDVDKYIINYNIKINDTLEQSIYS